MPQKNYRFHYEHLKNKWSDREQHLQKNLWQRHTDALNWLKKYASHVTTGSAASLLLFTSTPSFPITVPPIHITTSPSPSFPSVDKTAFLITDLYNKLPPAVQPLTADQEERITAILSARFGFRVTAELNGVRLNQNYGYIGQEQHLPRYPGDTIEDHFISTEEANKFASFGITPGTAAWGYFAQSKENLTPLDVLREKWYIAVPTFLSPGYNEHIRVYNAFFKYRKMLVVNPENGKAVVADIADAGPAEWTGKQLGGSPRVMAYLNRKDGGEKGPVLYFFIDDPSDVIPLGPIDVK